MGAGDMGFSVLNSLKAIDEWIATINSNMAGSARNGYKSTRVAFKGGTVSVEKPPTATVPGVQIAEQSLGVAATALDFSQGAIVASANPDDRALNDGNSGGGKHFFKVTIGGQAVYTRNGDVVFLNSLRSGADPVITGATLTASVVKVSNPDALQFSSLGSTFFKTTNATEIAVDTGVIVNQALEASNASLSQLVPELALAQKLYTAMTKVLQVYNQNVDAILNLIR